MSTGEIFLKKVLTFAQKACIIPNVPTRYRLGYADVAELADALDSGSSGSNTVWVQVPSSAPKQS